MPTDSGNPQEGDRPAPRPGPPAPGQAAAAAAATPTPVRPIPQPIFLEHNAMANQQQQRASLSSLMFMTFFFFMMSGGAPPMSSDEIEQRQSQVGNFENAVTQLQLYLNGSESNYTFSAPPVPSGLTLLPPYLHRDHFIVDPDEPTEDPSFIPHYYQNITGFYREADTHYLNLSDPSSSNSINHFFRHLSENQHGDHRESRARPLVNETSWNQTVATQKSGGWDWQGIEKWSMNVNEKEIIPRDDNGELILGETSKRRKGGGAWDDWSWIHVSALTFSNKDKTSTLDYNLAGVHQHSTGEYTMIGMPAGRGVDVRKLPSLIPDKHARNLTGKMVLFEMQRHLARIRADPSLASGSGSSTDETEAEQDSPSCPVQVHLRLLPVPFPYSKSQLKEYESEIRNPTGIYVEKPPLGIQMEGVAIFEECGVAFGLTGGQGTEADNFWRKSIHYAIYASLANLVILFLFVWEMEATRTPSGLAKVSFWSIVLMIGADSWLFSAHAVVAIMSDNITTLPLLIPSFLCLCTALVFGPRFGVMLHRVQSLETPVAPIRPTQNSSTSPNAPANSDVQNTGLEVPPAPSRLETMQREISRHPNLRWLLLLLFWAFLMFIGILPQIVPLLLGVLYSFWLPQIWRNARRGNRKALTWKFVLGMSCARLALPLYAFGCPDNVFFIETSSSIWMLAAYVWAQVLILAIQERFGASFFLPQRFAPPPPYDYHQPLPIGDSESGQQDFGNCSICMESILVAHVATPGADDKYPADDKSGFSSTAANVGAAGSRMMNMNFRRTYALAPCHHLFHTDCLTQWMAIKNTCPLCKRGLPPL